MAKQMRISDPLVIMFREPGGNVVTHIHPPPDLNHEAFGILVCDLVRHIANAYQLRDDEVWRWVDKERRRPTSAIYRPS